MPWAEITHLAHYPMLRASPPPPHILGVYGMWAPFSSPWTRADQLARPNQQPRVLPPYCH